jgi:outer membrane receptor for ferrienterochelin and colicins
MKRIVSRGGSLGLVSMLALAWGGAASAQQAPAVDVADLPPLPEVADEGAESEIAVVSAAEAEEDVVTAAAKREQSLGSVASAVTVISGDRLRRFGYRTVAEALRAVAGLYVVDDHMSQRLGVRGLQLLGDFNTRLLILVDGATVNEPWGSYAGIGWDTLVPIDDVARVEVIRGPVSSVYGTNAFFGIINIVTRSAGDAPRAWGRVSGGVFEMGTAAAGFAVGDVDHQLRGSVSTLYRGGESLNVPELGDEIDADGEQAVNASLVGAYEGAFAQVRFFRRIRELPWAPYDTTVGASDNRNYDTQLLAEGGYTRDLGDRFTVTGRAYVNRYQFEDSLNYDPDLFRDFGDALWYGGELRGRWAILRGARGDLLGLTAGGEATFSSTESRSFYEGAEPDGTTVPQDFNLQGLYTEVDAAPLSWLSLTGGARFDRNSVLEDRVSPRAALFIGPPDRLGLKLLYAEGFRNPSAYEGFFEDGVDFIANPDIGAEVIHSYEAVLYARPLGGLSTRLSAFLWEADDLVEQEEVDVDDGTRLQFLNVGSLTSRGLEAEVSYRNSAGWLSFAGASLAKVEDPDTEIDALNSPLVTTSGGVSTPLIAGIGHLSSEVFYVSKRKTRDTMLDADPFVGWNATVYVPDLWSFDLTVGVRNIIGQREEVPAQEDYDRTDPEEILVPVVPGEGREVYARLGYRY